MRRLSMPFTVVMLSLSAVHGQDATGTSTVTLGAGGGWIPAASHGASGGADFTGSYEYRIQKYISLEAGVNETLTKYPYSATSSIIPAGTNLLSFFTSGDTVIIQQGKSHSTSLPFGLRGILPLSGGRLEIFSGLAGDYFWNGRSAAPYAADSWGARGSLGARIAIDKQRRFWLGTTGTVSREFGSGRQVWTTWTADLGYRFGH